MDEKLFLNEFRQDLVSGEWVLFSTARKHSIKKFEQSYQSKEECPFEDPENSENDIVWKYPDNDSWEVMAIKNKYPAVKYGLCGPPSKMGPFNIHGAGGVHDVIIFRDHDTHWADFTSQQATNAIRAYKKRYLEISQNEDSISYIMIFHNYGKEAGASVYHPHSQIISTPILPPDVARSFNGSHNFYKKNKKRIYDIIIDWEIKEKKRIVYENEQFIAFCPFVSKDPYEVRIFPKESHAHFEKMPDESDPFFADAVLVVLKMIKKALDNPPYNFFIHTAPVATIPNNVHEFYHWHLEIIPKIQTSAGFEKGTGVQINIVDPDIAAEELRKAK